MRAKSSFEIAGWDEKPFSEVEQAGKLTTASVKKTYSGGIEGEGTLQYLMAYQPDGSAQYTGYERVVGHIGDRKGSFVLKHSGTYAKDRMLQATTIVEGSGTDGLKGIKGSSELEAGHDQVYPFTLEYDFA